jgi:hypothetical protein
VAILERLQDSSIKAAHSTIIEFAFDVYKSIAVNINESAIESRIGNFPDVFMDFLIN